jgi:hypothetical protein
LVRGRSACSRRGIILTETADYFAVIGTPFKYPAAGLIDFTNSKNSHLLLTKTIKIQLKSLQFSQVASEGMKLLKGASSV